MLARVRGILSSYPMQSTSILDSSFSSSLSSSFSASFSSFSPLLPPPLPPPHPIIEEKKKLQTAKGKKKNKYNFVSVLHWASSSSPPPIHLFSSPPPHTTPHQKTTSLKDHHQHTCQRFALKYSLTKELGDTFNFELINWSVLAVSINSWTSLMIYTQSLLQLIEGFRHCMCDILKLLYLSQSVKSSKAKLGLAGRRIGGRRP